jgi:hypothetical protein
MSECSVVPPRSGRGHGKVNEIPHCFVMLLHDDFFKLNLGLGCGVERTEVEFKLGLEQVPIAEPSGLGNKFAEDGRFAILECRASKVGDGVLDLGRSCLEGRQSVSKVTVSMHCMTNVRSLA